MFLERYFLNKMQKINIAVPPRIATSHKDQNLTVRKDSRWGRLNDVMPVLIKMYKKYMEYIHKYKKISAQNIHEI